MSRIELVKGAVNEQLNDSYDLLAMRLLFAPEYVVVNIQKEIKDLYVYPERLESSYCDEWRAIATRALFRNAFGEHWRSDEENLQRYLNYLRRQAIPKCVHQNVKLFRMLGEALAIACSDNTIAFPDRQRQALINIIWPEKAGGK
ncbi:hypothetical protein ABA45_00080 [Marinobacter psychrophilus]|jgi:hypothetical protein|uniref:Uncharacterized protein n=1 Tax=Marinobacter psychrophilus TaxID=330734 RepID=A0A0H4HZI6_9GAMM|nr:hypothetical protein [Marinobacter psychrophilus]AKO51013.1 hypothetical protein ABA45_00080 [Marinobacter psychrophilus]